jgi:hypothetical protein
MPNSVTNPKSLIDRLPAGDNLGDAGTRPARSRWLRRISSRIRGPGEARIPKAYPGSVVGRASPTFLRSGTGPRGIIPIEARPGSLTCDLAIQLPPGIASVTLDHGVGATPATGAYTDSTFHTVTYAAPGLTTVKVTAPADEYGEVEFTV